MTVGIGLIGCGRIASFFHLPILHGVHNGDLVAIGDADAEALARAGHRAPQAARHRSASAVISDPRVDAVVICTPPALHAPLAVQAFAAGKHVYVEKPLALSSDEGATVVQAWRAAGTVGMVGFNFRHHPAYLDLKRRTEGGELGELIALRALFTSARRPVPEWKRRTASGGGALRDLGAHHLDLLPWLAGAPISRVFQTVSEAPDDEAAGTAQLLVELESGVTAHVLLSAVAATGENRVEVLGTKGRVVADTAFPACGPVQRGGGRLARWQRIAQGARAQLEPRRLIARSPPEPSFARALATFVAAASGAGLAGPDVADGQRSLLAVAAAERSARSGRFEHPESPDQ